MNKIKLGIIGGGENSLVGIIHRIASTMNNCYEIVGGVFNSNFADSKEFAAKTGLPLKRVYPNFESLITEELKLPLNERMKVVSVLTPNNLHYSMVKKLLETGFHVICEKPLTTTFEEAKILEKIQKLSRSEFAVTYTYTGYPMIRQMKQMIASKLIGEVQKVDIQYYQGWINPIIHRKELRKNVWRLNKNNAGISCCVGDIGTHAFHMVEYLTGLEVKQVLADLNYLYEDNELDIDGTILIRIAKNIKGIIRTSQIATGEENALEVKIYGTKGGLKWKQENPNELYFLSEEKPLQILKPGHCYNSDLSIEGTKLPPGHPEGIFDAMANIYLGLAKAVRKEPFNSSEFPTLNDGIRGMRFIEQCVASHKNGNSWINL
jgi:predicted dehydrogenase